MGWPKLQPQASRLRQPTRMRPWRSLLSTGLRRAGCQAVKAARIRNAATCPSPSIHFLPAGSPPHASAERRNLHSISLWSAGSFLGDFRTPAGARNSSRQQTVCCEAARTERGHTSVWRHSVDLAWLYALKALVECSVESTAISKSLLLPQWPPTLKSYDTSNGLISTTGSNLALSDL